MSASAARLTANRRPDLASSHGRGLAQYDGVVRVEGWGSAGPSGPAPSRPSMHECGTRYQASDGAAQRTPGNPLVLDGDDLSAGLGVDEAARLVAKRGDVHWFGNEEVVVVGVRTVPEGVERRMVDGCRRNQAERPHIVAR